MSRYITRGLENEKKKRIGPCSLEHKLEVNFPSPALQPTGLSLRFGKYVTEGFLFSYPDN